MRSASAANSASVSGGLRYGRVVQDVGVQPVTELIVSDVWGATMYATLFTVYVTYPFVVFVTSVVPFGKTTPAVAEVAGHAAIEIPFLLKS